MDRCRRPGGTFVIRDPNQPRNRQADQDTELLVYDDEYLDEDEEFEDEEFEEELLEEEPASRRRRGAFPGVMAGLVLGIALSIGAILAAATVSRAAGPGSKTFNVLVLGTDQRPDERGGDPGRTDSIMLVSVGQPGGMAVISIPRDLWVPIPGAGEGRINTAYRTGELNRRGSGVALAERAVSEALGIHVDRSVLVDMTSVREIVDQLGGIDIDNPTLLVDDSYPTDNYGTKRIEIPAGRQHLDGELALAYARTRHQDSDFGRMARQQQVLGAILGKLLSPAGLPRLPAVIRVLEQSTQTDLRAFDAALFAPVALHGTGGQVRRLVIGPELATPLTGADGASLLQPSPRLRSAVADFLKCS